MSTSPYTTGAWSFLLQALTWAQKHNIYVILDLHGAPGSQNGYDNSGQRTSNPVWADNADNITRTVDTLRFLAENVGSQVSVMELLNEGAGFISNSWAAAIRSYFSNAYSAVRGAAGQGIKVMIGDAFPRVHARVSQRKSLSAPQHHEYQGNHPDQYHPAKAQTAQHDHPVSRTAAG